MAREVTETASCDVCSSQEDIQAFTLGTDGRTVVVDLCPKDAKPILAVMEKGSEKPRTVTRTNVRQGHSVVPIEDV
jgi:hypothetical protein